MKRFTGIIFPRIEAEVVDYAELQAVWGCGYQTAYRILHGKYPANHVRKEKLAEYLGIPVAELWVKAEPSKPIDDINPGEILED